MQRSFKSRLAALEALEAQARGEVRDWRWAQKPRYALTALGLAHVIVRTFRSYRIDVDDAGVVVVRPDALDRTDEAIAAIAEGLNAVPGWGDLFLSDDEIAQACWALDAHYLIYHVRTEVCDPSRTGWQLRLFVPYPDPFWAASRAAQAVHVAARVAERRGAGSLRTEDALRAWLATARPFVVSEALHDAIGDVLVSHGYAQMSGWFDEPQREGLFDDEEEAV